MRARGRRYISTNWGNKGVSRPQRVRGKFGWAHGPTRLATSTAGVIAPRTRRLQHPQGSRSSWLLAGAPTQTHAHAPHKSRPVAPTRHPIWHPWNGMQLSGQLAHSQAPQARLDSSPAVTPPLPALKHTVHYIPYVHTCANPRGRSR